MAEDRKFCADCKHAAPNDARWPLVLYCNSPMRIQDLVTKERRPLRCDSARSFDAQCGSGFSLIPYCGKSGRWFEPKDPINTAEIQAGAISAAKIADDSINTVSSSFTLVESKSSAIDAVKAWWWRLWTGQPSLVAKRRELEEECRRFGAKELPRWTD